MLVRAYAGTLLVRHCPIPFTDAVHSAVDNLTHNCGAACQPSSGRAYSIRLPPHTWRSQTRAGAAMQSGFAFLEAGSVSELRKTRGRKTLGAFCLCRFAQADLNHHVRPLTGRIAASADVASIIFKNFMDTAIGAVSFFAVGWAFAYGGGDSEFIGTTYAWQGAGGPPAAPASPSPARPPSPVAGTSSSRRWTCAVTQSGTSSGRLRCGSDDEKKGTRPQTGE